MALGDIIFVQLLQAEMFRYYQDSPNWCHFEYQVATVSGTDRVLFVHIEDQVPGGPIFIDFDPWFQEFASRDAVKLVSTRWLVPATVDQNYRNISEMLAEQITQTINRVYTQIPG